MAEGLTGTHDYAAQYRRSEWIERDGTPEEVADALLAELEIEFAKIEIPPTWSINVAVSVLVSGM